MAFLLLLNISLLSQAGITHYSQLYRTQQQTSQLSRCHRETHGFSPALTVSRRRPLFSRFSGRCMTASFLDHRMGVRLELTRSDPSTLTLRPPGGARLDYTCAHVSAGGTNMSSSESEESECTSDEVHGSYDSCDSESEDRQLTPPRPKKSKKLTGAATYKTKFNSAWIKDFPFITSVHGDPYR